MTPRLLWTLAVLISPLAMAGCGGEQVPVDPRDATEIPDGAAAVSYSVLSEATTPFSAIKDRRRLVIRDEPAWQEFWNDFVASLEPKPALPAVDFASHMVIAATMGERGSGGYAISVEEVAEMDGTLYAAVKETRPGASCVTATVITAPAVAVTVPKHDGQVAFIDREVTHSCGP